MNRSISKFDEFLLQETILETVKENEQKPKLITEITSEQEQVIENFVNSYIINKKPIEKFSDEFDKAINEGLLGRIGGGIVGLTLGTALGKLIAKILGISPESAFYKVLTSRTVAIAVGSALGK